MPYGGLTGSRLKHLYPIRRFDMTWMQNGGRNKTLSVAGDFSSVGRLFRQANLLYSLLDFMDLGSK